jgi:hypothetical protein
VARCALGFAVALAIAACTEQLVVRPEGEFSWEPHAELIWPVEGAIVSGYGDSARPGHRGVDLAGHPGDPVAAALEGEVSFVGDIAGYGKVVALTHGARLTTLYAHLGEARVKLGDRALRGQTIGTIGPDGYLHYEIRESKQPVDPAKLYLTAPNPVGVASSSLHQRLAAEPPSIGVLGAGGAPQGPPPTPLPSEAPRPARREATRAEPTRAESTRTPKAPPPPTPPQPTATPRAMPTARPQRTKRVEAPPPIAPRPSDLAPERESGGWSGVGLGAALVASNLLYVPAKVAYAAAGALTGAVVFVVAHDKSVADMVWTPTLGGDYFVTAAHLRGEAPLHFVGAETETRSPPVQPPPARRRRDSSTGASRPP